MDAPRGSVIVPVSMAAACVCARVGGAGENTIRETTEKRKNKTRTEVFMRIPLSRLAREVKVDRVSGIVSGFAAADSVGLLARRHYAARPSRPAFGTVARAGLPPPSVARSPPGLT